MIVVFRFGHRLPRDHRMTTHVALVARAFGADKIVVDKKDRKVEQTLRAVCERFGGVFEIQTGVQLPLLLKEWTGTVVHLTMYGECLDTILSRIPCDDDLLVIVGAEKVPGYIYQQADFNVAVGNQPHSEVAALALFLDRITKGTWVEKQFFGKMEVVPCRSGKRVIRQQRKQNRR